MDNDKHWAIGLTIMIVAFLGCLTVVAVTCRDTNIARIEACRAVSTSGQDYFLCELTRSLM